MLKKDFEKKVNPGDLIYIIIKDGGFDRFSKYTFSTGIYAPHTEDSFNIINRIGGFNYKSLDPHKNMDILYNSVHSVDVITDRETMANKMQEEFGNIAYHMYIGYFN